MDTIINNYFELGPQFDGELQDQKTFMTMKITSGSHLRVSSLSSTQ